MPEGLSLGAVANDQKAEAGHPIAQEGDGFHGNVHALMLAERSRIAEDELSGLRLSRSTTVKDARVGIVEDDGALLRPDRTPAQNGFLHHVIDDDHLVDIGDRYLFNKRQQPERERVFADAELAGVELRQDFVHVEDDARAAEPLRYGCEHLEVRQVMHMDQVIWLAKLLEQEPSGAEEKQQHLQQIAEWTLLVAHAALNTEDAHAFDDFAGRLTGMADGDGVHPVAAPDKRLGIAPDTIVSVVKRVGQHA